MTKETLQKLYKEFKEETSKKQTINLNNYTTKEQVDQYLELRKQREERLAFREKRLAEKEANKKIRRRR